MTQQTLVSNDELLKDLRASQPNAAPALEQAISSMSLGGPLASAEATIDSLVIFMMVKCQVKHGKDFKGKAGGIALPGSAHSWGDIYGSNGNSLDDIYSKTKHFAWVGAVAYFSIIFLDSGGAALGSFQGGAIPGLTTGTGVGDGGW